MSEVKKGEVPTWKVQLFKLNFDERDTKAVSDVVNVC